MAETTMRDVLDRLAAQDAAVAALHRTVQQQGTELARHRRRGLRGRAVRRFLPLALAALLVALIPLASLAAGPTFNDLNSGSVHNANIQAIADAGITKGCDPGVSYCPNGLVTREEMASFLARTAGLGTNPPVANAKNAQMADTATNATHAGSADTATTATNAGQLNGQPASFYQPAGQPIANATTAQNLQGYGPNGLVRVARGTGATMRGVYLTSSYQTIALVTLTAPGAGFVLVQGIATIGGGNASCTTFTRLRDTAGAVGTESLVANATITGTNTSPAGFIPVSPTWVFPVAAGSRTFVLEAMAPGCNGGSAFYGTITALFVPFAQDGGTTLAP